jgi:hypothetical protein
MDFLPNTILSTEGVHSFLNSELRLEYVAPVDRSPAKVENQLYVSSPTSVRSRFGSIPVNPFIGWVPRAIVGQTG